MIAPRTLVQRTPLAEHGGLIGPSDAAHNALVKMDFSTCLNAFGPANIIREAIGNAAFEQYPDPRSVVARAAIANRHDRPVSEIILGAGASELIQAACFAFLSRGDDVLIASPAFGEYERGARLCGAVANHIDMLSPTPDLLNDFVSAIERLRPRMVFLATPNSPAGAQLTKADVTRVASACHGVDALLLLDQSYDAFAAKPLGTPVLRGHENVLHISSLTKDHALAGLRIGFAICDAAVADAIERARVPWATSALAQSAAVAAMSDEAQCHASATIGKLKSEAKRIGKACTKLGLATVPSSAHFGLIECSNADQVRQRILENSGILVRSCTSFGLPHHIRVAARTVTENNSLIAALTAFATEVGARV